MRTVLVVGNPKAGSRTADAARILAEALGSTGTELIELSELGPGLLGWGDPGVAAAKATVQAADVAIFASPTFKATYTGLLKLFLDQFEGGTGLQGVVAIPLMLGGSLTHALAPEVHLKPVLDEIGGTTPAPGLYVVDAEYDTAPTIPDYAARWSPIVKAIVEAR